MTECSRCGAKAQMFLCNGCIGKLQTMLTTLATGTDLGDGRRSISLIEALHDAATGQTRLGESSRRSTDKGSPALANLGPNGDFSESPSQLLEYANSVLVEWCRDICETRGVELPNFEPEPAAGEPNDPGAPWLDAETVRVAQGNPGRYCEECFTYHRGECA